MGAGFHKIKNGELAAALKSAPDGIAWIVGRYEDKGKTKTGRQRRGEWHFQGISFDKKTAVEMCRDETYFVGPLPVNVLLPHRTIEWIGLIWPRKKKAKTPPGSDITF